MKEPRPGAFPLVGRGSGVVELRGFEPLTFSLRTRRATNCATAPGRRSNRREQKRYHPPDRYPNRPRNASGADGAVRLGLLRGSRLRVVRLGLRGDPGVLDGVAGGPGPGLTEVDGANRPPGLRLRDVRRKRDR